MRITVGSKSKHKLDAVMDAWQAVRFGRGVRVHGVSAPSNIPEQPSGLEQTCMGASNRARNAREIDETAEMYIGIESGIVGAYGRFYDIAFVVLLMKDGRTFSAMAGGHEVPRQYVAASHSEGHDTRTAGSVMAEHTGCDATDGTSYISNGHVSRKDTIVQAVKIALGDWLRQTK